MLRRLLIGAIIVGLAQTKILQGKIFDLKGGLAARPAHEFLLEGPAYTMGPIGIALLGWLKQLPACSVFRSIANFSLSPEFPSLSSKAHK